MRKRGTCPRDSHSCHENLKWCHTVRWSDVTNRGLGPPCRLQNCVPWTRLPSRSTEGEWTRAIVRIVQTTPSDMTSLCLDRTEFLRRSIPMYPQQGKTSVRTKQRILFLSLVLRLISPNSVPTLEFSSVAALFCVV
jgi:hypothetical protein